MRATCPAQRRTLCWAVATALMLHLAMRRWPVRCMNLQQWPSSIDGARQLRATLETSLAHQLLNHVRCPFVIVQVLALQSKDDQKHFGNNLMHGAFGIQEHLRTFFHLADDLFAWAMRYEIAGPALPLISMKYDGKMPELENELEGLCCRTLEYSRMLDETSPWSHQLNYAHWSRSYPSCGSSKSDTE